MSAFTAFVDERLIPVKKSIRFQKYNSIHDSRSNYSKLLTYLYIANNM